MPKKKNTKNAGISLEQRYTNSTVKEASKFLDNLAKKMEGEMTALTNIKNYIKDNLTKDVGVIYDRIGVIDKPEEKDEEKAKEDAKRQVKGYIEIDKYIMEQYRKLQTAYKKSNICKFYDEKDFFEKFKKDAKEKPECHGGNFFKNLQRNDELKKEYYNLIDSSAQKIDTIYDGNKDWLEKLNNLDKSIQTDTVKRIKNKQGVRQETIVPQYKALPEIYEILVDLVGANDENKIGEKLGTLTKAYDDAKKKKEDADKLSKEYSKAYRKKMKKMSAKEIHAEKEKNIEETRERKEHFGKKRTEWKTNVGNIELSWLKNLKGDVEIKIGKKEQDQNNENQNNVNKYEKGVVGDIKTYLLDGNSKKTWEEYEKKHFETPYSNHDLKKYLIAELNDNLKNSKEFQTVRSTINNILTENNTNKFLELLDFFADTNYSKKFKLKKGDTRINEIEVDEWKKIFEGFGDLRRVVRKKEWDINDMNVFTSNEEFLKEIREKIKKFAHENKNKLLGLEFNSSRNIPLLPDNSIKYSKKDVDLVTSKLKNAAYVIGKFAKSVELPEQKIKIKFTMWDNQENKTFEIAKVLEIIKTMQEKYAAYIDLKNSAKELFNAITKAHNDTKDSDKIFNKDGKYAFDLSNDTQGKTKVETNNATKDQYKDVEKVLEAYNKIKKPDNVQ